MKTLFIKDLTVGQLIDGETFALAEVKMAQDKNGKPYADIVLSDKSGRIKGKIWSEQLATINKQILQSGRVVAVGAKVDEFKGSLQLTVMNMREVDESKLDDFIETSRFDAEEMWTELQQIVSEIKNESLKQLLENVFADNENVRGLKFYPAGIYIHHGFRSGLLQHILEIIAVSKSLEKFYPEVDMDLVIVGAILHDIGKLKEFKIDGVSTKFSRDGSFVGHMIISYEYVLKYAPADMPELLLLKLKNMILSHHGKKEVGCPVIPITIEAVLLSSADDTVYKMGMYHRLRSQNVADENGMSEYEPLLGARVYIGE